MPVGFVVKTNHVWITEPLERRIELRGKQFHGPSDIDELLSMTMDEFFESSLPPVSFTKSNF